jgi:hypothetical protein
LNKNEGNTCIRCIRDPMRLRDWMLTTHSTPTQFCYTSTSQKKYFKFFEIDH